MTELTSKPYTETEIKIIEASLNCFTRYGVRKASMNDVARTAGVSRQTVYDLFAGKNGLIRALIEFVTDQSLASIRATMAQTSDLSDRLDGYFQATVIKSFELLDGAEDLEEHIADYNEAGRDEIARAHRQHEDLIVDMLLPYEAELAGHNTTPREQAHFLVSVTMTFKYTAQNREDLLGLLATLKLNLLSVVGQGTP